MTWETAEEYLSPECTLAQQDGYGDLHDRCRRAEDLPLPGAKGVLLVRRCPCRCHGPDGPA
ncbi:hypothetical protein ABZZ79_39355 [Streptomyces sp. NPDC006458]|uniref:hypothetical protein n=1 Tax=Streptomyces sp. NPDC006458 TaxID=3154302 RepID=UPI0033BD4A3A